MQMKRILVGVDGSKESRLAVQYAVQLGRDHGSRITLAGVVDLPEALGAPELMAQVSQWQTDESTRLKAVLNSIASEISHPGGIVDTQILAGSPAEALADFAGREGHDLVVVGHRGRGAIARVLLGSVADRLVQICPKPVTVVR